MEAIFGNAIWEFIGAIGSIIAILLTLILFFLGKSNKNLSFSILTNESLLWTDKRTKGKIKILFDGKTVNKVNLFIFEIKNNGSTEIKSEDFEEPFMISFGEKASILDNEIMEVFPKTLSPKIKTKKNTMSLDPLLLNSGDTIMIKLLISELDINNVQISSRIVGISEIKNIIPLPTRLTRIGAFLILIGTFPMTIPLLVAAMKEKRNTHLLSYQN